MVTKIIKIKATIIVHKYYMGCEGFMMINVRPSLTEIIIINWIEHNIYEKLWDNSKVFIPHSKPYTKITLVPYCECFISASYFKENCYFTTSLNLNLSI